MDLYKYFKIILRNQKQKKETKASHKPPYIANKLLQENWAENLGRKIGWHVKKMSHSRSKIFYNCFHTLVSLQFSVLNI